MDGLELIDCVAVATGSVTDAESGSEEAADKLDAPETDDAADVDKGVDDAVESGKEPA